MRFADVVAVSTSVAQTSGRLEKVRHLAGLLSRTPAELVAIVAGFLAGEPRQGRLNVGFALLSSMRDVPAAAEPALAVADVDEALARVASASGAGSARSRAGALRDLFARATGDEQDFIARLLGGGLRQGALEGVLVDAVARAAGIAAADVRRAAMLAGDIGVVAQAVLGDGAAALSQFVL